MMEGVTDEQLWKGVCGGDQGSFDCFYQRHQRLAVAVAAKICGDDAEDAVQAAFLSAWRSRDAYAPARGNVRTWFLSVVRNRAIDRIRAGSCRPTTCSANAGEELEDSQWVDEVATRRETAREVRAAVTDLPGSQREVIELSYFREFSQSEIASALGIPLGTVKGRSRLALGKLRETCPVAA